MSLFPKADRVSHAEDDNILLTVSSAVISIILSLLIANLNTIEIPLDIEMTEYAETISKNTFKLPHPPPNIGLL